MYVEDPMEPLVVVDCSDLKAALVNERVIDVEVKMLGDEPPGQVWIQTITLTMEDGRKVQFAVPQQPSDYADKVKYHIEPAIAPNNDQEA